MNPSTPAFPPQVTRCKICGITRLDDARAAIAAGAHALGFMFYEPSPRWISSHAAAELMAELPPFVSKVGVFVDASEEVIRHTIEVCQLDTVQLHGSEPPELCRRLPGKVIKAFRVRDVSTLEECQRYRDVCWLLDSYVPGTLGGSGETFNWDLARTAAAQHSSVILAGGLTPNNVADAIRHVRPYGVDVSSGVESALGRKDPAKLQRFLRAVRTTSIE